MESSLHDTEVLRDFSPQADVPFWEYDLTNIPGLLMGYEVAGREEVWDQFVSVQVRFDYRGGRFWMHDKY